MPNSMDDISSESIVLLRANWEKIKDERRYEEKAGSVLFLHLFRVCPDAQVLFGFSLEMYTDPSELLASRRFQMHASFLIQMIDETISFLGQDHEKLIKTCAEIGKKHATYGVKPEYFPFMTESIIHMLKSKLGGAFTEADKKAWEDVFSTLIVEMVAAQKKLEYEEVIKNKTSVVKTWKKFYEGKDKALGGAILFKHLFTSCPEAKPLFGFPVDFDLQQSDLLGSKRFTVHSSFLIDMINQTVLLLGNDNEKITKTMMDLGKTHVTYGVKPGYFPYMTASIIHVLKDRLGSDFTREDEKAWKATLGALITDMVKGQRKLEKGLAAVNKVDVIKSWRILAQTQNFEERAGVILFKHLFQKLPQAKVLFGFPLDMDTEALSGSKRFLAHATFLISMVEKALNMLGEDDETLTAEMRELGKKHILFRVRPEFFPFMTEALVEMMQEILSVRFEEKDKHAWEEVFGALIADMTIAQREHAMTKSAEEMKKAGTITV